MNFALVSNGMVENTIACESYELAKDLYPGHLIIAIADVIVAAGWVYDGEGFIAPEIVKTPEQIAEDNLKTAQSEYDSATIRINALTEQIQDSDWGELGEGAVRAELGSWIDYRKLLRAYLKLNDGSKDVPLYEG